MLVLSRKQGEKIMIGDDVTIMVVRAGETVRIGIEAPRGVIVDRAEVFRRRQESQRTGRPEP